MKLADIPPGARGLPFEEWRNRQLFAACASASEDERMDFDRAHPVQTARDRYGWRGLRGTSYIGRQAK